MPVLFISWVWWLNLRCVRKLNLVHSRRTKFWGLKCQWDMVRSFVCHSFTILSFCKKIKAIFSFFVDCKLVSDHSFAPKARRYHGLNTHSIPEISADTSKPWSVLSSTLQKQLVTSGSIVFHTLLNTVLALSREMEHVATKERKQPKRGLKPGALSLTAYILIINPWKSLKRWVSHFQIQT